MTKQTQSHNERKFAVQGMHCASCSAIIVAEADKYEHISDVHVSIPQKTLSYSVTSTEQEDIFIKKLAEYGYTLESLEDDKNQDKNDNKNTDQSENNKKSENKKNIFPLWLIISFVTVAMIGMIDMIAVEYNRRAKNLRVHHFFHGAYPILATLIYAFLGGKYIQGVKTYLKHGVATMETLIGLGTGVAFIYSFIVSTFGDLLGIEGQVFREAVIVVIGFIEIGKHLEKKVMNKTGNAIKKLLDQQAKFARKKIDDDRQQVALSDVQIGDILLCKNGEKIPVDGTVEEGETYVDEAMLHGEPLPSFKKQGDTVLAGTIVSGGKLAIVATHLGKDSYIQQVVRLMEKAQNSKPKIQKLVDTIMQYFVPGALTIALISGIFWGFFGTIFFPDIDSLRFGLTAFVGVLVIACPCGLGLATPMAVVVGVGHGAKKGILSKNAEGLLGLRKVTHIIFDKTGTLTQGKPQVSDVEIQEKNNFREIAMGLEEISTHPLALAIINHGTHQGHSAQKIANSVEISGEGIIGEFDNKRYFIGKPGFVRKNGGSIDEEKLNTFAKQGKTPIVLAEIADKQNLSVKKILGIVYCEDEIKESAQRVLTDIKKLGIEPVLCTGDKKETAHKIAGELGITLVYAEVSPEEKENVVADLQQQGHIVAMVGDGINDSLALARAHTGIAMGNGTDIAIESADITLLNGDIEKIIYAWKTSQLTNSAIKQNLTWAFMFNLIGIPLAAGVFFPLLGVMLNPAFEGIAMAMSSLLVVANSLRLERKNLD